MLAAVLTPFILLATLKVFSVVLWPAGEVAIIESSATGSGAKVYFIAIKARISSHLSCEINLLNWMVYFSNQMASQPSQSGVKINQRLLTAPAGTVLTVEWLKAQGISRKLANYYAISGWLHRVGDGAFTLKSEEPDWLGAVFGLQQKPEASFHPGGRTALELASAAHFLPLGAEAPVYLFSRAGERVPAWFRRLPWARRVRVVTSNFLLTEAGLKEHQAAGFTVKVSAPERAILELLFQEVDDAEGYEHARLIFEGLGTLRPELVQALLEQCSSVKVKRLFLHFAELLRHPWFRELNVERVSLGSGKRVLVRGGRLDAKYLITVPAEAKVPDDAP